MITIQAGYALVIDDEPANRDFLERLLQTAQFKVTGAGTGADGLRIARAFPELALALVDQELPDATGLEIISQLRAENPEALLVMATMHDDRNLIDQAFETGIDVFLVKPHGFMELYRRLQEVDSDTGLLRRVIIDQYGPRPYRGDKKPAAAAPDPNEVTRPALTIKPEAPAEPKAEVKTEVKVEAKLEVKPENNEAKIELPVGAVVKEMPKPEKESNPDTAKEPTKDEINAAKTTTSEITIPSRQTMSDKLTDKGDTLIHRPRDI